MEIVRNQLWVFGCLEFEALVVALHVADYLTRNQFGQRDAGEMAFVKDKEGYIHLVSVAAAVLDKMDCGWEKHRCHLDLMHY